MLGEVLGVNWLVSHFGHTAIIAMVTLGHFLPMPIQHHVRQYRVSTKLPNICLSEHMCKSLGMS